MVKRPTGNIKDDETRDAIDSIQAETFQNPLTLSAAPAAAAPLLEDNASGFYDSKLYVRKDTVIYVFTPSSTITIT